MKYRQEFKGLPAVKVYGRRRRRAERRYAARATPRGSLLSCSVAPFRFQSHTTSRRLQQLCRADGNLERISRLYQFS